MASFLDVEIKPELQSIKVTHDQHIYIRVRRDLLQAIPILDGNPTTGHLLTLSVMLVPQSIGLLGLPIRSVPYGSWSSLYPHRRQEPTGDGSTQVAHYFQTSSSRVSPSSYLDLLAANLIQRRPLDPNLVHPLSVNL